ncbi:MAG TPA: hypothetical protein VHV10_00570, partial [Ktedonobacteraceae bacterium]|nr:hypothetical protein [Ktedonobacteraceae bacterium]
ATLWKRFGFDDVPDALLEEASRKCGGYPQWIELRASDLDEPGHLFLWPGKKETFTSDSVDNKHTKRLKVWLKEETIFDATTDINAREELMQVFSRQLSYPVQQVLDLLAASPLGLPFSLLKQEVDHPERAIDELMRCSLIDHSSTEQGRAALVSLAREARLHQLSKEQREQIEQRVTDLYAYWLYDIQQYQDDAEQAALIAELVVLYIKKRQFLEAGELLATYGWLCAQLGHMSRIERYASTVRLFSPSSLEEEDGRALLYYQVMVLTGKKADAQARQARQAAYRRIHMAARQGTLRLQPHTETHIAHVLILPLISTRRYTEAYQSLQEVSDHISWDAVSPEARAAFLHSKAYVLREWSDSTEPQEDAKHLRDECITVLGQVIDYWRSCMENTLPLSERYMKFKLARALNDFAYCSRLLGRLSEAEEAIKECVDLKKQGATLSSSLGISLGEQAQIFAAQGKFEQSHVLNQEALDIMSALIEKGNASVVDEKGVLLDERAHVYLRQARLQEAKALFEEVRDLLRDTLLRQNYRDDAIKQIEWIESLIHTRVHYQLDQHWFEQLHEIAFSDDVEMLTQAGPFTREEQHEWDKIFEHRSEREAKLRMKELIAASQERELAQSLTEQRPPQFHYPFIDTDDISSRITRFQILLTEIEAQERNAVVRRLYKDRITEELHYLHLFEAVSWQDTASVQKWNEVLYGKPNQEEMSIALGEFAKLVSKARKHPETQSLSEHILAQLKQWHIHLDDFLGEEQEQKGTRPQTHQQEGGRTSLSASRMQQIIEEVLAEYGFAWDVLPSPERDAPAVDKDRTTISLPTRRRYPLVQVLDFVAEEIEQHVYRSEAGKRSPLALLQSGTKGYLATEEGLGIHYIQKARETQGFEPKNYSWITTLAPGLAAGVIFPPMNFRGVYAFLEQAFLLSHLLSGKHKTFAEARKAATQDALKRTTRTFRGVPDLNAVGVCSLKDRIYLQGHLAVSRKMTTTPMDRLLVGAIGIEQLEDIAELHILESAIRHRDLASSPEWLNRLIQIVEKERGE